MTLAVPIKLRYIDFRTFKNHHKGFGKRGYFGRGLNDYLFTKKSLVAYTGHASLIALNIALKL